MSQETLPWSTNESARLWRKRVQTRSIIWGHDASGQVYVCPRCGWESMPMAHREGALRLGGIHDLECR